MKVRPVIFSFNESLNFCLSCECFCVCVVKDMKDEKPSRFINGPFFQVSVTAMQTSKFNLLFLKRKVYTSEFVLFEFVLSLKR